MGTTMSWMIVLEALKMRESSVEISSITISNVKRPISSGEKSPPRSVGIIIWL